MTADERVSILYYEICCTLLHRWNFDRSNVKADMNEMCRQCGATYDELRSILKHLRTKYLQPFRDSVRSGDFQGDFFSYYCSIKRPRGRPPAGTLSFPSSSSSSQPGAAAGLPIASFNMGRQHFNPAARAPRPARVPTAAGEMDYPPSGYPQSRRYGGEDEGMGGSNGRSPYNSQAPWPSSSSSQPLQRDACTSVYHSGEDLDEDDDHVQFTFASPIQGAHASTSTSTSTSSYARDIGVGTSGHGTSKPARRRGGNNVVVKRGRSHSHGSHDNSEEEGSAALLGLTQGAAKRTRPVSPPNLDDCELLMGLKVADSRLPASLSGAHGLGGKGPSSRDETCQSPRSVSSTATRVDIRHMSSSPLHASTKTLAYDPSDSPAFFSPSSSRPTDNARAAEAKGRRMLDHALQTDFYPSNGPSNGSSNGASNGYNPVQGDYFYDPRGGYPAASATTTGNGPFYRTPASYPQPSMHHQGGYTLGAAGSTNTSSGNQGRGNDSAYANNGRSGNNGQGNYVFPPNGYNGGYGGPVNMEERSVASLLLDMSNKVAQPCAL